MEFLGIDMKSGGTWMGVSKKGKIGIVLNLLVESSLKQKRSRGNVRNYMTNLILLKLKGKCFTTHLLHKSGCHIHYLIQMSVDELAWTDSRILLS